MVFESDNVPVSAYSTHGIVIHVPLSPSTDSMRNISSAPVPTKYNFVRKKQRASNPELDGFFHGDSYDSLGIRAICVLESDYHV